MFWPRRFGCCWKVWDEPWAKKVPVPMHANSAACKYYEQLEVAK